MALSVVNSITPVTGGGVTSITSAAINITAGNLIVVGTLHNDTVAVDAATPITDSVGNTYIKVGAGTENGNGLVEFFYAKNVIGGAAVTITYTLAGAGYPRLFAAQVAGADATAPLDKGSNATFVNALNDNDASVTSPTIATTSAAEILFGIAEDTNQLTTFSWADGGAANNTGAWTVDGAISDTTTLEGALAHAIVASAGSYAVMATVSGASSAVWLSVGICSFKASSATTRTQTLVGATSSSGVVVKLAKKAALSGVCASAGVILRSHGKLMAGAATNAGVLKRAATKALSGLATPAGAMVQRVVFHLLGLATSTGAQSNFHGNAQALAGSSTPAGALRKVMVRSMAGAATPVGLLTSIAGTTPGSFVMSPSTFSGTQARTVNLFGINTSWTTSTTWTTTFSGANLAADLVVVTGATTAIWYITPGSGVGTITLSDGAHSAVLTVLATILEFDELVPCLPAALDELAVCA